MDIEKNTRSAYFPMGGYDFVTKVEAGIKSKTPAELIQTYAPSFDLVIEKYIMPNYEYLSTHLPKE